MKIDINKVSVGSKIHIDSSLKAYHIKEVSELAGNWVTVKMVDYEYHAVGIKEYNGDSLWDISCFDMFDGVEYE